MPASIIVNGGAPGVAVVVAPGALVQLDNATVEGKYEWTILDQPINDSGTENATALSDATIKNPTFTATSAFEGSYRVRLRTNGGGVGQEDITLVIVLYKGERIPAYEERVPDYDVGGFTKGWKLALHKMLRGAVKGNVREIATSGYAMTEALAYQEIGGTWIEKSNFQFDPDAASEAKFRALVKLADTSYTGDIRLYNITTASIVATVSHSGDTNVTLLSANIAIPSGTNLFTVLHQASGGAGGPASGDTVITYKTGITMNTKF